MDTSRTSGRAAAAASDARRLHLEENAMHIGKPWKTWWHTWQGGAVLVTWLAVGMLSLEKSVQAAPSVTSQAAEKQSDHREADDRVATNGVAKLTPNAKDKIPQGNSTVQPPSWSRLILPALSFSSQNASAWARGTASVTRGGKPKQAGLHTRYKQGGAEQLLPDLREAGAEDNENMPEFLELQSQCAQLNLDCSWVHKLVSQHLRRNAIAWTAMTRAAVGNALKKIAELVHKFEHRQVVDGTALPTDPQPQRSRLTLQAQRLLEEHVVPLRQSSLLHGNMPGPMRTEEGAAETAQATNQSPVEDKHEETKAEATETAHAKNPATADAWSRATPADSVKGLLSTANDGDFGAEHAGPDNQPVVSGNVVDTDEAHLLFSETVESPKPNTALQPLLVLPWRREIRGAVTEDDGLSATGESADDVQATVISENESDSEDIESSQLESELVEGLSESERSEERSDTRRVINSSESTILGSTQPLLQGPHRTIHIFMRGGAGATGSRMKGARRGLTVGQLETLLQSRGQRRRRRLPLRPLIFPSCYFNAPMQKRMREKAALLAASLEQLNDAVEALTELGVVVEKQTELVEKAVFTVVYRDRLMNEPASSLKPLPGDDLEGERNSDTPSEENVELVEEALMQMGSNRSSMKIFKTSSAESGNSRVEEKLAASATEPQKSAAMEKAEAEEQAHSGKLQNGDDTYKKLVGANGVRKQLRELFASWELARRAAGASEMPNEIMRRAEMLRRELVLPLQQDLQQLNLLDATLSLNHVALQRLLGCRGFINAVRRTVSRAEEDLYNLGAHAFANEVSLPLMAHDLQHHVADLLEYVVQLQLQHHRALHVQAASLISLHREFFRSARELQQEATARLKDDQLQLAMPAEEWHEIAQRLSGGVLQLRVDLARQLVALKSVDKKAARLEGILNLLQGGLEHLLHVEVQLQQIRKSSGVGHTWPVFDEEEEKDEARAQNDASDKSAEKLKNGQWRLEKEDHDAAGLKGRNGQHGSPQDVLPPLQARVFADADEALSLELPPKIQRGSLGSVPTDLPSEAAEDKKAMEILQRLLGGVLQMAEFLQMYKQQSSDAEQLLRSRFHIAQESVQKATGVAQMIVAQPLALNLQRQDQKLRDKIPSWARSVQRQGLNKAKAEDDLKDSAALVRHVKEKVRSLDAALFALEEPSLEENSVTGREVVARIGRINSRFFKKIQRKQGSRSEPVGPFCVWRKKQAFPKKPPQKSEQGQ